MLSRGEVKRLRQVAALLTPRLSRNTKTGVSLNADRSTCRPDPDCAKYCYGALRRAEDCPAGFANTGPITWPNQQALYKENAYKLRALSEAPEEVVELVAERLSEKLHRAHGSELRLCGLGDLVPGTVRLIVALSELGVHCYGFSRRADMLQRLVELSDQHRLGWTAGTSRPFFQASIDKSTEPLAVLARVAAALRLTGKTECLSVAVVAGLPSQLRQLSLDAVLAEQWLEEHPARKNFRVVFGYHGTAGKTIISHPLACPATNGISGIHCSTCRRCIDG